MWNLQPTHNIYHICSDKYFYTCHINDPIIQSGLILFQLK